MKNIPLSKLKHHVTGAVERGERTAIQAVVKSPLQINVEQAIEILHSAGASYKYEGHTTTIDTNELTYVKNVLIAVLNKGSN